MRLHRLISDHVLQVANHLDRAVSGLGRQPLKVLVQVNTSGEACKFSIVTTFLLVVDLFATKKQDNKMYIQMPF